MSAQPSSPEIDGGAEFLPPADFTPHTQIPTWIILSPLSPQARSAHEFLFAHVDQSDGTFLVTPSMASIAKFLGVKSENSARKYVAELKEAELITAVTTYWDRKAKRRTTKAIRDDGVKNDQTSNTFQMRWTPPQGRLHPGPLTTGEWYKPSLIEQRLAAEKTRRATAPPHHSEGGCEQEKPERQQVTPPLKSRGGPPSNHEGDPPHQFEDEEEQEKKNNTNQAPDSTDAGPAAPATDSAAMVGVDVSSEREPRSGNSPGTGLLRSLAFPDGTGFAESAVRKLAGHVDTLLTSGWTEERLVTEITDATGIDQVKSWPAFVRHKLEGLKPVPAKPAARPTKPPKCPDCDESRMRRAADGRPYPCSTCHPRALREQRERAQHQEPEMREQRGETAGGIDALDDLLAG